MKYRWLIRIENETTDETIFEAEGFRNGGKVKNMIKDMIRTLREEARHYEEEIKLNQTYFFVQRQQALFFLPILINQTLIFCIQL